MNKNINLPNNTKIRTFGHSMYPLLHDNDIVHIKKVPYARLKINDIVVIKNKNFVTHRIVYKSEKFILTKGDNNMLADKKTTIKNIVGKVDVFERKGKSFSINSLYLVHSTLYLKFILDLLRKLRKKNIKAVVLKGLPLHLFYEKSHPHRLYADCDLLVDIHDRDKIREIFIANGYYIDTSFNEYQQGLDRKIKEEEYYRFFNDIKIVFDVHYTLCFVTHKIDSPLKKLNFIEKELASELMQRSVTIRINESNIDILEINFLNLIDDVHHYMSLFFHHHKTCLYQYPNF